MSHHLPVPVTVTFEALRLALAAGRPAGRDQHVSVFHTAVVARNLASETRATAAVQALVDTHMAAWHTAHGGGITPRKRLSCRTATGEVVTRDAGHALLSTEGFETVDDVVFGEPGDLSLLGVRTLEAFAVMVDYIGHRFVARTSLVA
jgi:hypothetical protein